MSAQGVHKITEQFEQELCKYTGAPYCVAIDNCSNALFLALYYELNVTGKYKRDCTTYGDEIKPLVTIPRHTYPSVACEIIHAGGRVVFKDYDFVKDGKLKGYYFLNPTNVIDSALKFTSNMYVHGFHMCLSFTGPYKHLKLGKGGAILTDDKIFYHWAKRARFSGRQELSYHDDNFDESIYKHINEERIGVPPIAGWNFYMMPEIAARGSLLLQQFYNADGTPKHNEDLCLPYPDLSKFKIFQQ